MLKQNLSLEPEALAKHEAWLRLRAKHYYRAGLLSAQHAKEVFGSGRLAYEGNDYRCARGAALTDEEALGARGLPGSQLGIGDFEVNLQYAHDNWLVFEFHDDPYRLAAEQHFATLLGLQVNLR